MKEILETTHLEFDKSSFLIDLAQHDTGILYIEITQIVNEKKSSHAIKINPSILTDVLRILQSYQAKISHLDKLQSKHLTDVDHEKIQSRYFKGVSIKDLALQFDQTEALIEMLLRNKGIQIVSNELPKKIRGVRQKRTRY